MNRSNDNDLPEIAGDETLPDALESNRPRPLTIIITFLVLLAMLTSLIWPLLYAGPRRYPTPTPTPSFLQEVRLTQPGPTAGAEVVRINIALHQEGLWREQGVSFIYFLRVAGSLLNPMHNPTSDFMLLAPLHL